DMRSGGKLPARLVFGAPFTMDKSAKLVSVASFVMPALDARLLQAGIFVWAVKSILGSADGATALTPQNMVDIRTAIDGARQELDYATLKSFLASNYSFTVMPASDANAKTALNPNG